MDPELVEMKSLLLRDLDAMRDEVRASADRGILFTSPAGVSNPVGSLALHVAGNLQHYIGAVLGSSGYLRRRDEEFSCRCGSEQVLRELEQARAVVETILPQLPQEAFDGPYPLAIEGRTLSARTFLWRLTVHLSYHLGQAATLRRSLAT